MSDDKAGIVSVALEDRVFDPPKRGFDDAWVKSMDQYRDMYQRSIQDPEGFWGNVAKDFVWFKKWNKVRDFDFKSEPIKVRFFEGGKTNITVNCLDRHVQDGKGDRVGLIWEPNDPKEKGRQLTYRELKDQVCKFANVLKSMGIKKGDRVTIFLPMIPELAISMMACARIGAIHSIVFGGFSAEALADRIVDAKSHTLITCDGVFRGAKPVPQKVNADAAIDLARGQKVDVTKCIVVRRAGLDVSMIKGRDLWWHQVMEEASAECKPEEMDAEDPLFILYTSGSTGKPKGVLHTVGGYMVFVAHSFKYIFDYHDRDIFWCTADIGWVTGHSYIVYGPLANGATSVMFEGVPTYPDPGRFWATVDKYKVSIFYTAPTAIRALAREGDDWVKKYDLSSLRLLGSVGEPINPEAWIWYHTNVGRGRCPIVDTWWQTETGGILITPLPAAFPLKPGSATLPYFGVKPVILRETGAQAGVNEGGLLCIEEPWPGMMRSVYGDPSRFGETYFRMFPGIYFTGDGARKDEDGYYWLMGRVDDVINVSGHRMGTAEIESALVSHPKVAESAVVGFPHDIKGQGIYAFVTVKAGVEKNDALLKELVAHVRKEIGPIATPDKIHFADGLPKTRSGKIMRRILRKIAEGESDKRALGDTTTLADPSVVDYLLATRPK
ncbi:MAG: acetate--CoA ligase [bacterium]